MDEGGYGRGRVELRQEGSDLSDLSGTSTLVGATTSTNAFSPGRRPRYTRLGSEGGSTPGLIHEDEEGDDIADTVRRGSGGGGLGIETGNVSDVVPERARRVSIQRISNPSIRDYASPKSNAPGSSDPLVSPPPPDFGSARTAYDPVASPYEAEDDLARYKQQSHPTSLYDDTERLRKHQSYAAASIRSTRSAFETNDFHPHACPSAHPFYQGRFNWLALTVLILAIFSTVFSGLFLGIAIRAPRWGKRVHTGGSLTPATADILTQVFAKLIELSFVTCFVTFLGQVLSRRAFSKKDRGVTIAEITMRNWVMQPGSMITHYETVQYAALTFLGMLSLSVAVFAMLYSTAASALVAPQLKFGGWENKMMHSLVKAQFSNVQYLQKTCQNPIQVSQYDTNYNQQNVGNTCLEIDHAAQGFHNYKQYLSYWDALVKTGNATNIEQAYRPPGFGLFNENVTVNASWIHNIDTGAVSTKFNRTINNVTLAFPHSGVVQASVDPINEIMQPQDLDGLGLYNIRASVPSPYVHTLCANFEQDEYKQFVYQTMDNVTLNTTLDFSEASTHWYTTSMNWTAFNSVPIGQNPLDEIFGWEKTTDRPAFYKFPIDFNTILNNTFPVWGRDSIYLLGKGDPTVSGYFMCRTKAGMTPYCSTQYEVMGSGGNLRAHCEDKDDPLQFLTGNTSRTTTTSLDWFNVGTEAFNSLSLNNGVTDGAAANARLLTQLMLREGQLNPALPSPAEAISVLVGCTLLMGAQDAPFVEFWNYTVPELSTGVYQNFNASIRAQQYASGGTSNYQRGFYVILFAVFALNLFVLVYLLINKGLVTDFSEPPNLFSLAVNSPPSRLLAGSCGAGPVKEQFKVNWGIETEGKHLYLNDRNRGASSAASGYQSVPPDSGNRLGGFEEVRDAELGRGATFEMDSPGTPAGLGRQKSKFGKHLSMLNKRKSFF